MDGLTNSFLFFVVALTGNAMTKNKKEKAYLKINNLWKFDAV